MKKRKIPIIILSLIMLLESINPVTAMAMETTISQDEQEETYDKPRLEKVYDENNVKKKSQSGAEVIDIDIPSVNEELSNGKLSEEVPKGFASPYSKASNLPSSYNTLKVKKAPKVANQGKKNTCWAFAATNAMSIYMLNSSKFKYNSLNLSETQLAYYEFNRQNDSLKLTGEDKNTHMGVKNTANYGKNDFFSGGNSFMNSLFLSTWAGIYKESTDPKAYSKIKNYKDSSFKKLKKRNSYKTSIAHLENSDWMSASDTQEIKKAIMKNGAVSVTVDADINYLNPKNNAFYKDNTNNLNSLHEVTLVGWDDNYSNSNFKKQPSKNGAWIALNSWGKNTYFADSKGCFRISYCDKTLSNVATYELGKKNNYDYNYQYDGDFSLDMGFYANKKLKAANEFVVKGNVLESIEAIGIATASVNTTVKVEVYKNIEKASNPKSGKLVSKATTKKTIKHMGFHTIKLKKPVIAKKGSRFAIVVTLTKSGYKNNTVGILAGSSSNRNGSWYKTNNETGYNQSFILGNRVYDLKKSSQTSDLSVRIKAFTKKIKEKKHEFKYVVVKKADTRHNGKIKKVCSLCGKTSYITINKIKSVKLSAKSFVYSGKAIKPGVTVKDSKGKIIKSKYYKVRYANNRSAGKAKVTIKFRGRYKGSVSKTFKIRPKKTGIKALKSLTRGFKISLVRNTSASGYEIFYSTDRHFNKNKKRLVIKNNLQTTKIVRKLRKNRIYYVRVRAYKNVGKKKYYSYWSKTMKVKTK
ncbi:Cysteine protease, C1A family [Acetitomaculum ruminis DSM 5522]|uniref:Cysteine protease, C1A family n=1 Tax=Acetitomaculum ruminis DSM 5522 TaxID=1120918 RepID=A0A1I0YVF5_9FIRM|nr:lectin like domain-containing protein [Acetitomaculum ruminis]SFB16380.1 Cysteine protease, C1A family [Acetitomaculum ruminis DSM 5522]